MSIQVVKKHLLLTRWNHWINFPVLTIMVWSGLLIYWANPVYLLPDTWLDTVGLNFQLAKGMAWHFAFGILFLLNGLCYVIYLVYSKHWRYILPDRNSVRDAYQVFLHDFHLRKEAPPAHVKYNGAQRLTYSFVILLGILAIFTGFAIYKPIQLNWLTQIFGGYRPARLIHFLIALSFVGFFVVHIIQVTRSGWNNFRAMITGLEKKDE